MKEFKTALTYRLNIYGYMSIVLIMYYGYIIASISGVVIGFLLYIFVLYITAVSMEFDKTHEKLVSKRKYDSDSRDEEALHDWI